MVSLIITSAVFTALAACAGSTSALKGRAAPQPDRSGVKSESDDDCKPEYSMNAPKDIAMFEELKVKFTAPANHDPKGWIGVFLAGSDPKGGHSVTRENVGAVHECSGSVTLKGLPSGQYVIYYFLDADNENPGPRSNLTVHTPV
jgi:hypothetical protein